jgi:GTP cyclohydrolase I
MLKPHGVAVYLEAKHLCTPMRGVNELPAVTRTAFWRGHYDGNDILRSGFLRMCGVPGRVSSL